MPIEVESFLHDVKQLILETMIRLNVWQTGEFPCKLQVISNADGCFGKHGIGWNLQSSLFLCAMGWIYHLKALFKDPSATVF